MGWMEESTIKDISNAHADSQSLLDKRLSLFKQFKNIPMPTTRDEEWRYTDISKIKWDSFDPKDENHKISIRVPEKILGMSLKEASQKHPDIVKKYLGKSLEKNPDKFALMSSSFWNEGYLIYVPKDTDSKEPISISMKGKGCMITNILVVVEEGSSVKIIEDSSSEDGGLNLNLVEIFVGPDSNIDYYFFQDLNETHYELSMKRATLQNNSVINWNFGSFGGKLSKTKIETFFEGQGSHSEQKGVFFGGGDQHIDVMTNAFHDVPNTSNNILVRGVLKDSSSSIYRGLIKIEKAAQQTNSYLSEHSLMIGEKALANSIPSLEIEANDVKASHGSTTGKVDEDQIFYLMSRGLDRKESEKLVVEGFFTPIIEKIPSETLRNRMSEAVNKKMGY